MVRQSCLSSKNRQVQNKSKSVSEKKLILTFSLSLLRFVRLTYLCATAGNSTTVNSICLKTFLFLFCFCFIFMKMVFLFCLAADICGVLYCSCQRGLCRLCYDKSFLYYISCYLSCDTINLFDITIKVSCVSIARRSENGVHRCELPAQNRLSICKIKFDDIVFAFSSWKMFNIFLLLINSMNDKMCFMSTSNCRWTGKPLWWAITIQKFCKQLSKLLCWLELNLKWLNCSSKQSNRLK